MKKALLPLALAGLVASPAFADDWGLFLGVDAFETNLDNNKQTQASGYVALEHSIIILPNVRVAYDQLPVAVQDDNLVSVGAIISYQLFDNSLFEFDFGMNWKTINGAGLNRSFPQC